MLCITASVPQNSMPFPTTTLPRRSPLLKDHADIAVPPSKEDFVMAGNLRKRRGGFGKMSQNKWKNRCFVLLKTGNLCYFQADSFKSVNFCEPPRGILTLDEDVVISKNTRPDGDLAGAMWLVIQGGGQRWKLSSETPGEIKRWEEALRSMAKGPVSSARISVNAMRSPTFDSNRTKTVSALHSGLQERTPTPSPRSMSGERIRVPTARAIGAKESESGETHIRGAWTLACVLTAVDVVCYFIHQRESSLETFFAAVFLLNLVVGWGLQRSTTRLASRDHGGVPLIHGDDVGPLRVALKRRFPAKKDSQPVAMGDVGEIACGIPVASSTTQHNDGPAGALTAPPHSWSNGVDSIFRVRGKGYMQDRIKVPPAESLYDMVGLDMFSTEARVGNMASEVVLDPIAKDLPEVSIPGVPPLLVINVQLPSAPPALMTSAEDGPGYQCVLYFRMKDSTARAIENLDTASEGVRLWVTYCERVGVDDDFHGRFKCIAVIANSESLGLPSFVTKYNGKPVLINRSGHWVKGENYIENTINVHRFSFIAKKSLHTLKALFKDMVLHLGFTIEGRAAEELPESLLACSTLHYPMLERVVEFDV
ncbi:unnamed protein product [Pylaiella littoralis]